MNTKQDTKTVPATVVRELKAMAFMQCCAVRQQIEDNHGKKDDVEIVGDSGTAIGLLIALTMHEEGDFAQVLAKEFGLLQVLRSSLGELTTNIARVVAAKPGIITSAVHELQIKAAKLAVSRESSVANG